MRVLMITPEVTPFAQTGGLGEVLSALPGELAELGVEVDVFMPKYRGIDCDKYGLKETGFEDQSRYQRADGACGVVGI